MRSRRKACEKVRKIIDDAHKAFPNELLGNALDAMDDESSETLELIKENENASGQMRSNSVPLIRAGP